MSQLPAKRMVIHWVCVMLIEKQRRYWSTELSDHRVRCVRPQDKTSQLLPVRLVTNGLAPPPDSFLVSVDGYPAGAMALYAVMQADCLLSSQSRTILLISILPSNFQPLTKSQT